MSVISETNKPRNVLHSFDYSKGNTFISFLSHIVTLSRTCGEIINWRNMEKLPNYYDYGGRLRNGTLELWYYFLTKNVSF